jgi:hypothetical protein
MSASETMSLESTFPQTVSLQGTAPREAAATFDFYALRFRFIARDPIHFPGGGTANLLRGQLGRVLKKFACVPECADARTCTLRTNCLYAFLFEPAASHAQGPSGLRDRPRPFVLRVRHLDGLTVEPGVEFCVGLNLFETQRPLIEPIHHALTQLAEEGFGPGRGRAAFKAAEGTQAVRHPMAAGQSQVSRIRIRFMTPTELKGVDVPEFGPLFARIRDRISTLRALYGAGPLQIAFHEMGARAAQIRMTRCDLQPVEGDRVSRRTGQRHSLGGWMGEAEYQGDLAEFVPYLEIARWTGVGRQTVWGKGEIEFETL